ncbi:triose-phosphate isomerase [Lichenicoccus sp.]|uniref:triose-phosphate isomerase n=1 Tax=Lichenicoccus sp. TaxID=2781899 RepID=UPI003D09C4B2
MRQVIAGNWKMNGLTADAQALAQALRAGVEHAPTQAEVLVFPPYTQIATVARILAGSGVGWGGQDCHMAENGPHTGDISPDMLRDLGATHVILGHSERRRDHNELDETVREKTVEALRAGLIPIVCVGESEEQRAGSQQEDTVGWQIKGSLPDGFGGADGSGGLVAYEPVWAIGTGRVATVEDIAAMHAFVRGELVRQMGETAGRGIRILYGGSVNAANAASVLAVPEVAGALVGGASLKATDFLTIIAATTGLPAA